MKIDVHNHFTTKKLAELMEKRTSYPYARMVGGTYQLFCSKNLVEALSPASYDIARRVEEMDSAGIDVAVLSFVAPGPELFGSQADEIARIANDELAGIIATHPGRFWGYASIGFGDIDVSLKEMDRCFSKLGFRGLGIFSNIAGKPLDLVEFRPIFQRMAELDRPIFVHPTLPLNQNYLMEIPPFPPAAIAPVLAFIVDTTLAAMRLALSGAMADYATSPIIIPHVGGVIPYLMSRLDSYMSNRGESETKEPSRLLKKLYMDTVAYGTDPLQCCLATMGAEQLLFGSDYPFGQWRIPGEILGKVGLSEEERAKIERGNAEHLFRPLS